MSTTWTIFNSFEHLKDYNGKLIGLRGFFDFKKDDHLDITELKSW